MTAVDFCPAPNAPIADLTGDYLLDPEHSRIGFVARHAMVASVRGEFADLQGTVHLDTDQPVRSSAEVFIRVASLTTGNAKRDAHLRSNDFFDVEAHPNMTFTSAAIDHIDGHTFRVVGDLTIKDTTRPILIDLTCNGFSKDPYGALRAGFEGTTTINRRDWGLTWNVALETGGLLVSDAIRLEFDLSATREPAIT